MTVECEIFESSSLTWEALCDKASEFASSLDQKQLINISIASSGGSAWGGAGANGIITVWYWED